MGIKQRGPFSFQVYYYESGKQVTDGTYDTKAEALKRLAEIELDRSVGKKVERKLGIVKVKDALQLYEDTEACKKAGYAKNGEYRYRMWKDEKNPNHLQFLHENVASITPAQVTTWMKKRLTKVSASTLNRDLNELSAFFSWCRSHYEMYSYNNPVADVKRPASNDARDRTIEEGGDEEKRLLKALEESNTKILFPAFIIAIETAMRRKELCLLTWDRIVNLESDAPYVILDASNTKTKKRRSVPLSEHAVVAVKMLQKIHEEMKSADERLASRREQKDIHDYKYLLAGIKPNGLSQAFAKARKEANVYDFRWHDLRHCATTRLLELGLELSAVATVTGHSSYQTLKRYTNHAAESLSLRLRQLKKKEEK